MSIYGSYERVHGPSKARGCSIKQDSLVLPAHLRGTNYLFILQGLHLAWKVFASFNPYLPHLKLEMAYNHCSEPSGTLFHSWISPAPAFLSILLPSTRFTLPFYLLTSEVLFLKGFGPSPPILFISLRAPFFSTLSCSPTLRPI